MLLRLCQWVDMAAALNSVWPDLVGSRCFRCHSTSTAAAVRLDVACRSLMPLLCCTRSLFCVPGPDGGGSMRGARCCALRERLVVGARGRAAPALHPGAAQGAQCFRAHWFKVICSIASCRPFQPVQFALLQLPCPVPSLLCLRALPPADVFHPGRRALSSHSHR